MSCPAHLCVHTGMQAALDSAITGRLAQTCKKRIMSSDGCQTPNWTGQAFSYLMHHPASSAVRPVTVASAGDISPAPGEQAATGVWDGPAPRGYARSVAADAAAEAAGGAEADAAPAREVDAVPLPGDAGRMPLIGFGTYKIESPDAIRTALEAGYRHLDCAPVYGNEAVVGEAIKPWIEAHGRDSLFVTSKIWNDAHRPELARESVAKTLADLGVQKLDLLLMHWPDAWVPGSDKTPDAQVTVEHTWRAMEALVDDGKAAAIGVSNFSERQLDELLAFARIRPVVNQVELHPLLSQRKLVGACNRKGITCVAYGPLGHSKTDLLAHPEVEKLAKELGRSTAQVLLKWNVQRGVAVLPKASSAGHVKDNIEGLFDWRLSYDQKARLDALDQGKRFVTNDWHDFED